MQKLRKKLVSVRLPPSLWARVKALALLNDRSYTAEVIAALERHVQRKREESGETERLTREDERRAVEDHTGPLGDGTR